ncbi:hypothetical protein ACH4E7_39690 [Kitasatospora sp. NPDC018058]|uniref:hypothetical protein n=1 Tax=Kitasatospora sp. NPDC018058 TaxID=3364025 RepID=UPI0037C11EC3
MLSAALAKRTIGNLAAANLDQLARAVKGLEADPVPTCLVDGCLAATGLILDG